MKKFKIIIAFSVMCMLSLTACKNNKEEINSNSETTQITTSKNETTESLIPENEEFNNPEKEEVIAKIYEPDKYDNLNYSEYVDVKNYEDLEKLEIPEVTDEEINSELDLCIEYSSTEEQITDRKVKEGDTVFCSLIFGEDDKYDYIYIKQGDNIFGEGLESAIIGMTPGEEKKVKTILTEDAGIPIYANKETDVTINVVYIVGEINKPELNDQFVTDFTGGAYNDLESFKKHIKEDLEKNKTIDAVYEKLNEILENSTFNDISELTNEKYELLHEIYKNYASEINTEYEDMVISFGFENMDKFNEELKTDAENIVKQKLVIYSIADKIDLKLTEEEYKEYATYFAMDCGYSTLTDYLEAEDITEIRYYCILQKIVDFYSSK